MGCSNCGSGGGLPGGCKNNGNCSTSGCNKLDVFDWLSNMSLPSGQAPFNIVEVRFKNGRKHFFKNESLQLCMGEVVTVEGSPGHDVGTVSLTGELVRIQMKKKGVKIDSEEVKKIYRKASQRDVDIWEKARNKETETQRRGREILGRLGLKMKLSDVEYQGDGNKATFYYTAEDRVDFRQLIRDLASAFSIRVEMKQVGLRQEAARLGGIGSCGRELCCSTWLTDFRSVSTSAARYQQLSLNPQKLAGQCGKLKCCLNYELDMYMEAVKDFPSPNIKLHTKKGVAYHLKTDIFKRLVYYIYDDGIAGSAPLALDLTTVNEIIAANKAGDKFDDLKDYEVELSPVVEDTDYLNVVGQDSLTRFDSSKKKKKRPNRNTRKPGGKPAAKSGDKPAPNQSGENKPRSNNNRRKSNPKGPKPQGAENKPSASPQGGKPQGGADKGPNSPASSGRKRPPRKPRPPNKD